MHTHYDLSARQKNIEGLRADLNVYAKLLGGEITPETRGSIVCDEAQGLIYLLRKLRSMATQGSTEELVDFLTQNITP